MKDDIGGQPWLVAGATQYLIEVLERNGNPARFVGGCVRDSLLQEEIVDVDIDIATPERPKDVIAILEHAGIKVRPTGLKHGTVTAIHDQRYFEITTLRRDVQTDGRHAEVTFTDDFDVDAARRDFTINALRADRNGTVADPFGGMKDLASGRIRFVGEPAKRVQEDYLRILRYFRFFARFGEWPPDDPSLAACETYSGHLQQISGERIQAEMAKLLLADRASAAAALMIEAGVGNDILLPKIDTEFLETLSKIEPEPSWQRRLALWLRAANATVHAFDLVAARWPLATTDHKRIATLIEADLPKLDASLPLHRRQAYECGKDRYVDRLLLAAALSSGSSEYVRSILRDLEIWVAPTFPLRGDDLIALGVPQGPELGFWLRDLEAWWLDHEFAPDRAQILAELRRRRGAQTQET